MEITEESLKAQPRTVLAWIDSGKPSFRPQWPGCTALAPGALWHRPTRGSLSTMTILPSTMM